MLLLGVVIRKMTNGFFFFKCDVVFKFIIKLKIVFIEF
jgi:hypothetical protein